MLILLARAGSRDPTSVEFTSTYHRPNTVIVLLFITINLIGYQMLALLFLAKFIIPEVVLAY